MSSPAQASANQDEAQAQQQQQPQQQQPLAEPHSGRSVAARRFAVQRELERMQHVVVRLQLQHARNSKRTQIAELRARDVEVVRKATDGDARVREQLMVEQRMQRVKQHERVVAFRDDLRLRAESARREVRMRKLELARVTKEQHKVNGSALSEVNADRHDRNIAQHNVIRKSEQQLASARARSVDRKRELAFKVAEDSAKDLEEKEAALRAVAERAVALQRLVEQSRSMQHAAHTKLQELCASGGGSSGASHLPSEATSPNAGEGAQRRAGADAHGEL
jgi:hypothetical protein